VSCFQADRRGSTLSRPFALLRKTCFLLFVLTRTLMAADVARAQTAAPQLVYAKGPLFFSSQQRSSRKTTPVTFTAMTDSTKGTVNFMLMVN
jgi:hypothetical protein